MQLEAVDSVVRRVLCRIPAELLEAALFGSRARRQARPDSDIDILLIFRRLPPDREPHASYAEGIADEVSAEYGIPVTVWSVSLVDIVEGNRTPMLVDALFDSVPIWCRGDPIAPVSFTPRDAFTCADTLLLRVAEGGRVFDHALSVGDWPVAAHRARDDIVRLCTAWLLVHGCTRPRRGEAVRSFGRSAYPSSEPRGRTARALSWAAASFGWSGRDEDAPVAPPPGGFRETASVIRNLATRVRWEADWLGARSGLFSRRRTDEPARHSFCTFGELPGR